VLANQLLLFKLGIQYIGIDDLPMANHAEAVSGSALLGQTVVKVDYNSYQLQLIAGR
jgi:hypothetical protein